MSLHSFLLVIKSLPKHFVCPSSLYYACVQTFLSGIGFLSDAYDLFVINLVKNILASIYPQSTEDASGLSTAALVGAVFGQLVFGSLADRLGRKTIFVVTISLVIIGAFGSALSFQTSSSSIYSQLIFWRALLGFGVGGYVSLLS